ncbi:Carbohydrate sulfotransferase 9 [Holothuria leucospilota]|uniref:Carbohydrate sulfotransferase n=1 Tax=Holothuria leucospilota TaxID=206669 RepID=A0A9Q1HJ14_HOLLE|nr:Carbohydrate sulfotransferase 9 [Holothuria leucospilota]
MEIAIFTGDCYNITKSEKCTSCDSQLKTIKRQKNDYIKTYSQQLEVLRNSLEQFQETFIRKPLKEIDQAVVQSHRRAILRKECNRLKKMKSPEVDSLEFPPHLLVDDQHGFLFCQIRKVSSIAWRQALDKIIARDSDGSKKLRRLTAYNKTEQKMRLREYKKFLFVREPMMRLLSAWQDKFVNGFEKPMYEKMVAKYIARVREAPYVPKDDINVTFAEFFGYISGFHRFLPNSTSADFHWQTYNSLCKPCAVRYDFIGHFENILSEANWILKELGIKHFEWTSRVPSVSYNTAHAQFVTLSAEQRQALYDLYRTDYDMFGYSIDKFWHDIHLSKK